MSSNSRELRDKKLFDRIAKKYTSKDIYPASRAARRHRLLQTVRVAKLSEHVDMLEIGCGAGFAAEYLQGSYRSYTGIDYSQELIDFAIARHQYPNTTFKAVNLYNYKPDRHYNLIVAIGVLHHMVDIPGAMQAMYQLLKPGGCIVVNEPHPANRVIHSLRQLRARLDNSYSEEQEELDAAELLSIFQQAGLYQVQSLPQGVFSTPFAEVILKPRFLTTPISHFACATDALLETYFSRYLSNVTWNLIVKGYKES